MNRTQLKNYAPAARRDFITAVTNRARTLGITNKHIADAYVEGDVLMIDGRPFPSALAHLRKKLVERVQHEGFDQVMQAMAYTWFNRFVAIRYMELHGYLDHGYRVLSHPQGQSTPEILQQASHVDLPGLDKEQIIDLQLNGNKDAELYRLLLIAQCNALHSAMPFLFERIDDETELLLPDNLLHSDSVIRQLVNSIDEENWNEIEIIGWLYQFYISERKDEVMGKVVASADIPAATQLFTPNWIVKYLVQNSIGAQWLATYPDSGLKERMNYYIEPAEQTEEVKQQLAAITPDELNPEELTLIDPACGSGHILVEAYDLFKELYRERGYPRHKIPKLILEKNLYGLDIDTRAAQMAGFALLMKARVDSPKVLGSTPKLNIHALHDIPVVRANEYAAIFLDAYLSMEQEQPQGLFSSELPLSDTYKQDALQFLDTVISIIPRHLSRFWKGKKPEGSIRNKLDEVTSLMDQLNDIASECRTIKCGSTDVFAYLYDRIDSSSSSLNTIFEWCEKLAESKEIKPGKDTEEYWKQIESYLDPLLKQVDAIEKWCHKFRSIYSELSQGRKYYELMMLFEHGCTFGSLIEVPEFIRRNLSEVFEQLTAFTETSNDIARRCAVEIIETCIIPAQLLAANYDAVVANPPYMGGKGMNAPLKKFAKDFYKDAKADLFACFIERGFTLAKPEGHNAMVTMQSWMFLSSYQAMRENLLETKTIKAMAHLGPRAFSSISGEVVQTSAFIMSNYFGSQFRPSFFRLTSGNESEKSSNLQHKRHGFYHCMQNSFSDIPGKTIAYWITEDTLRSYQGSLLSNFMFSDGYVKTGNNEKYLRLLWEVDSSKVADYDGWRMHPKGGDFRRWSGNVETVVNWWPEAISHYKNNHIARVYSDDYWDLEGICWSAVTGGLPSFRFLEANEVINNAALCIFATNQKLDLYVALAYLNSVVAFHFLQVSTQTVNYLVGDVFSIPYSKLNDVTGEIVSLNTRKLKEMSSSDWASTESTCGFKANPLTTSHSPLTTIKESYKTWQTQNQQTITQMKQLEEENNRLFIDAYDLQDELTPEVPIEQITLTVNPPYRYGAGKTVDEYETLFRTDTMKELVSYAIGRMMGRYSLNAPGLIYAHSGGQDFAEIYQEKTGSFQLQASSFQPDNDGIIPITDTDWFADDACNRLVEFIETAWPREKRDENLMFLAEGLGKKASEAPVDTLRRYLSKDFFKDHLKTYKKRPIYWLFSSGKQKAFECLVYLHRYNEGTLSRMRVDYVQPLLGKYESRIKLLQDNIASASSTSARKKMEKELTLRQNQQLELRKYDEQLRHYTDQRIALDLDDGVKVNYGKFGTLLANVKDVTGKKA